MKRFALAALLTAALASPAFAACPTGSTALTFTYGALTATKCITTADQTGLQNALAAPLIASGIASPTGAQEWTEAVNLMAGSLNDFAKDYLLGQAQLQAPAVTYVGPQ